MFHDFNFKEMFFFFFLLSIQRILKHNTLEKMVSQKNKQQTSKDADLRLNFIMKYINTENRSFKLYNISQYYQTFHQLIKF